MSKFHDELDQLTNDSINGVSKKIVQEIARFATPKPLAHKKIDAETLVQMVFVGCVIEEIAAHFNVGITTLYRRYGKLIDKARVMRKLALRRAQTKAAFVDGDTGMMIWLGKNELGQKNYVDLEVNGTVDVRHTHDFGKLTDAEIRERLNQSVRQLGDMQAQIAGLLAEETESSKTAAVRAAEDGRDPGVTEAVSDPGSADEPLTLHSGT